MWQTYDRTCTTAWVIDEITLGWKTDALQVKVHSCKDFYLCWIMVWSVTAWRHSDVCGFQVSPLNLISNVFNVNTNRFDGSHKNLIDLTSAWRRREVLANHGTVNALVYFSSGANQRFERHRKWRVRLSQLWRAALAGVRFQRSRNSIDLRAPLSRNGALYHHAAAVWIRGLNRNPDPINAVSILATSFSLKQAAVWKQWHLLTSWAAIKLACDVMHYGKSQSAGSTVLESVYAWKE